MSKQNQMTEQRKRRVLVVDDEKIIADSLTMILSQSGFEVRAAYSGETALEMALSFCPDLLISDVIMPGITGIEAATRIRAILPSCKVLLFSGQATTQGLLEEARMQNQEFELLLKPIHPTELLVALRKTISN
jgi:CheY-like chemotaxis protein